MFLDKSFIIFLIVGIGFFYVVTDFVQDIEKDDGYPITTREQQAHKYDRYIHRDSIDRTILVVDDIDRTTQLEAWRHSDIKKDFLSFYPQFDEMRKVIKERVITKNFQSYLLDKVNTIEREFLSGSLTFDQSKKKLEQL